MQEHIYIINILYVHLNGTRGYRSNKKCVTDELQYSIGSQKNEIIVVIFRFFANNEITIKMRVTLIYDLLPVIILL